MFSGTTTDGIYGSPSQSIEIPTAAGTATAVTLPFASTNPIQATPWDGAINAFLNWLMSYAVWGTNTAFDHDNISQHRGVRGATSQQPFYEVSWHLVQRGDMLTDSIEMATTFSAMNPAPRGPRRQASSSVRYL